MTLRFTGCLLTLVVLAGCAARVPPAPPAIPAAPAYPDFVAPDVPAGLGSPEAAARTERGWLHLQNGNEQQAQEEFDAVIRSSPGFHPALAGRGYVALARGRHDRALEAFQWALDRDVRYAPALVGRGQALLALNRDADALQAFESALAADPSLTQLQNRVEVLRFRRVQSAIEGARAAAAAGDTAAARREYDSAIAASPESAFLYRELGAVERRAGNAEAALARFTRAADLDALDAESRLAIGELLEARGDLDDAREAYSRAFAIDPSPEVASRLSAIEEGLRGADLPPDLGNVADAQMTRAQLATLVRARFEDVLSAAPARQLVMTDTRGHAAEPAMQAVAATGVLDLFENYAFQPESLVRRVDLAEVVRRLARLADPTRPGVATPAATTPAIADVTTRHLNYPAIAFAVASSLMPLLDSGRFEVARPVSGAEAADALARLRSLIASGR